MKKSILVALGAGMALGMSAQSPIDAYQLSQQDLKGTARFMSMGGAFGALGGDLSTLSQNPGGIGVYRSSEVGLTMDIDCHRATTDYQGFKMTKDETKFLFNNIGIVGTLRLNSSAMPNLNIGFTYNRANNFYRRYSGGVPQLKTSLSNYIAGIANNYSLTEEDVRTTDEYDPYRPYGRPSVPWSAILGYDSYLIDPEKENGGQTNWYGQFGNGTTGSGYYQVEESGYIDEYNISLGGNIANKVFWGMTFGINSVNYNIASIWGENMENAYVYDPNVGRVNQMNANWSIDNLYNVNGTGFNYKLGVIVRPIQQIRIGLAFHTPTYYKLTENFYPEQVNYNYQFRHPELNSQDDVPDGGYAVTNNDEGTYNEVKFQSPWKVIASVAGVIGTKGIISLDYEWNGYRKMSYQTASSSYYYYDYGDWYPSMSDEELAVSETNEMIKNMYCNSNTIRVGGEYRVLDCLSVRAGYSYTSSPVKSEARDGFSNVPTNGTLANFRLDNSTHYVTCGLGYRYKGFYADAAYVWKHQTSEYYPFSPDPYDVAGTSMKSNVCFNNSQVVISLGYKF